MSKNILLTEAQYRSFISYLTKQRMLNENSGTFGNGYRTYQIKKWLDYNFIPSKRAKHGEFDMLTNSEYCAIIKNTMNEKEPTVVSPKEMYEMLVSKFSNSFSTPQERNESLKDIVNAWFGYGSSIKVFGGQNPEAIVVKS